MTQAFSETVLFISLSEIGVGLSVDPKPLLFEDFWSDDKSV